MKKIVNARVITPFRILDNVNVYFEKNKIIDVSEKEYETNETIDAGKLYLSPGFIDLHTHGGAGFRFDSNDVETIKKALVSAAQSGTTSVLAAGLIPDEDVEDAYRTVINEKEGPQLLGVHAESLGRKYVYDDPDRDLHETPTYDFDEYKDIPSKSPSIKMIGVDPSIKGAREYTKYFVDNHIHVSISHCGPSSFEEVMDCVEAGADSVTHLYTGMSGFYRDRETGARYPGVIETALLLPELMTEVIGNGAHLTGQMLNLIYKNKGSANMYLVTDSQSQSEPLKEGELLVTPRKLPTHTSIKTLAQMDYIVRKTYQLSDIPLQEVIKMATYNPAKYLGLHHRKGVVAEGYDADILLFDDEINVKLVIARGKTMKNTI